MPRDVTPKVRGITPRWALPADDYVTSLAWSPAGDILLVGDASGALRAASTVSYGPACRRKRSPSVNSSKRSARFAAWLRTVSRKPSALA